MPVRPAFRGAEITALTGLRFIAAAVVLHHIGAPAGAPEPLVMFIRHGYVGLPLFVMLTVSLRGAGGRLTARG